VDKVHLLGNIKWASTNNATETQAIDLGRPYVLAASTHDNEEQQLAHIWKEMAQQTQRSATGYRPSPPSASRRYSQTTP